RRDHPDTAGNVPSIAEAQHGSEWALRASQRRADLQEGYLSYSFSSPIAARIAFLALASRCLICRGVMLNRWTRSGVLPSLHSMGQSWIQRRTPTRCASGSLTARNALRNLSRSRALSSSLSTLASGLGASSTNRCSAASDSPASSAIGAKLSSRRFIG